MDMLSVTVVTVTRGRPHLLPRAHACVLAQDFPGHVEHLVVVDDDEGIYRPVAERLGPGDSRRRSLRWHFATRLPGEVSGPPVLARLRNMAVELASHDLIAFLDDDNLLEPHHLSSLADCMTATGMPAVHAQRQLVRDDLTPYLDRASPWRSDPEDAARRYFELAEQCVLVPWSNVLRDQVEASESPEAIRMVDTSEWLFTRELLQDVRFNASYTEEDWRNTVAEDAKLLEALVARAVPVASTHMPTLLYVLGGYSNVPSEESGVGPWSTT